MTASPAPSYSAAMLLPFFTALRDAKVPVSMKEWLHLMEAMDLCRNY